MRKQQIHEIGRVIPVTEAYLIFQDEVLVFKRSRDSKVFPGYLSFPGGHIDEDNDILKTMIAEIREETGIRVKKNSLKLKAVALHNHLDRGEIYLVFIYRAVVAKKPLTKKIDREGRGYWQKIRVLETAQDLFPPVKPYLRHILENKSGVLYTNIQFEKAEIKKVLSASLAE